VYSGCVDRFTTYMRVPIGFLCACQLITCMLHIHSFHRDVEGPGGS